VLVTPADVTDRDAACGMLSHLRARYRKIQLLWADGGYTGRLVDWARKTLQLTLEVGASPGNVDTGCYAAVASVTDLCS
jgi:hypothetical protein